jgi:ComF family protein
MLSEVIAGFAPDFGDEIPMVVPVPLHERKLRERGFNQSELIAQAALKMKPAGLDLRLAAAVLRRLRATQSQTGLSSHQRRENIRGAFRVADGSKVAGKSVLLVDDVFTTGTTVSECARQLHRAGATRIWVATVARTLKASATHADFASHEEGEEVTAMAAHV